MIILGGEPEIFAKNGMETFLWSGEDRIAGAAEVPKTTGYRPHAAERVLFAHSFKNLQAPSSIASTCPPFYCLNGQQRLSFILNSGGNHRLV